MKFVRSFEKFLNDTVNLNKTRLDRIVAGASTVSTFLQNNPVFKPIFRSISPQGSYRQKTIIKPASEKVDFDVDLMLSLVPVDGWQPKDYLERLHGEFKRTDRYKDIVDKRGKTRCVTLDYESDFHIDIVPTVRGNSADWIMNRTTNHFEPTDADGYAQWFIARNVKTTNDLLIKVVRLIKYLRDRRNIPVKSVVLTTLLGQCVQNNDTVATFPDLPTTFSVLLSRLDDYLQSQSSVPTVQNPVLPSENFNRHWDQASFVSSKNLIHQIRVKVNEALSSSETEDSLEKWRAVFGDEFPLAEEDLDEPSVPAIKFPLGNTSHAQSVTTIPGCFGERLDPTLKFGIRATLHYKNTRIRLREIMNDGTIGSGYRIKYQAWTNTKEPYDVFWQVVNTGEHARRENGLRGGFFKARLPDGKENSDKLVNWEYSSYTGKHWVECVIIKASYCVARQRFYVNIKNPAV